MNLHELYISQIKFVLNNIGLKIHPKLLSQKVSNKYSFPSIKSVSDLFYEINIPHLVVELPPEKLSDIPYPAIFLLKNNEIVTVTKNIGDKIEFYDVKKGALVENALDFLENWTGVVILLDNEVGNVQTGFSQFEESYKREIFVKVFAVLIMTIFVGYLLFENDNYFLVSFVLMGVVTVGLFLSILAFGIQNNISNPSLYRFCNLKDYLKCNLVIGSEKANILGVGMSEWSVFYFGGSLLMIIVSFVLNSFMTALFVLKLLIVPALVFCVISILIQIKIRKWCPICIGINLTVAIEFIILSFEKFYWEKVQFQVCIGMFFIFLLIPFFWIFTRTIFVDFYGRKILLKKINYFEENESLLLFLLEENGTLSTPPPKSILIGDSNSHNTLTIAVQFDCIECHKLFKRIYECFEFYRDMNCNINVLLLAAEPHSKRQLVALKIIDAYCRQRADGIRMLKEVFLNGKELKHERAYQYGYSAHSSLNQNMEFVRSVQVNHTPACFWNDKKIPSYFENYDSISSFLIAMNKIEKK